MTGAMERRRHPRYPIRCKTTVILVRGKCREFLHGHTRDLSLGGANILCDHGDVAQEAVLVLLFTASPTMRNGQARHIEVHALIVHMNASSGAPGFILRVQFTDAGNALSGLLDSTPHHENI